MVLRLDGKPTTVRLIGIDTPETVHPSKPIERFGKEASAFLRARLAGKSVRVEYEPGGNRTDRYGRTLAYLHLDGQLVNREIIAKGYGFAYTKYPFSKMEDFRKAEREAREKKLGLWGVDPSPAPSQSSTVDRKATVYVTKTGEKYHAAGCRYLGKSSMAMTLAEASKGRAACSVCHPPDD